jgi:hypothetical protein
MTNQQPTDIIEIGGVKYQRMTNQQPTDIIEIGGVKYQRMEDPKPQTLYDALELPYFTIVVGGVKYQRMEDPKPQTLYDALDLPYFTNGYMFNNGQKEWICNVVEKWMPNDDSHDEEEFQLGWNACLKYLRENIK